MWMCPSGQNGSTEGKDRYVEVIQEAKVERFEGENSPASRRAVPLSYRPIRLGNNREFFGHPGRLQEK